jgi:hypothetical protein
MRTTIGTRLTRVASVALVALLVAGALTGCGLTRSGSTASVQTAPGPTMSTPSAGSAGKSAAGAPATSESAVAPLPTPGASGADASTVPAEQRLIVRNKTLRLEVKDVPGAIDKLRALAASSKADITDMQVATSPDTPIYRAVPIDSNNGVNSATSPEALSAYLTVRVPAADFQRFVDDASKLGRLLYQAESASDVTQQHIDLAARLTNLRAEEARLRDFLNAARNVTEMLAVESELNRVRGDIESMSAQLAYLERQAALATVTFELVEPQAIVRPAGTDWGWNQTFTDAIRAFVNVVEGIIVVTGALLPLALLALAAFFIIRALVRRSRKRRAAKAEAVAAPAATTAAATSESAGPAGPPEAGTAAPPDTTSEA